MATRVAINGFGRIGRLALRAALNRDDIEVVAINDLTDAATLSHLFKYDSVHRIAQADVKTHGSNIVVNGRSIPIFSEPDPSKLPWGKLKIDIVLEATGRFAKNGGAVKHIQAGAKKVVVSAPAKGVDATIVLGVNDGDLKAEHKIVSNASCTTNCLAPMAKVMNDNFGIKRGLMTTIHAYTGDQRILDAPHKDMRRARSAAVSMIPTSTGAAIAVGVVLPELDGKLDGMAVRVPTPDGSLVDLVLELDKSATVEEINAAFKKSAEGDMKGFLSYTDEPLVSIDIVGNPSSCIFDSLTTKVMGGNMVKILGWYDNEMGYATRCIDLMERMIQLDTPV